MATKITCPYCNNENVEQVTAVTQRAQHSHRGTYDIGSSCRECGYRRTATFEGVLRGNNTNPDRPVKDIETVPKGYMAVIDSETKEILGSVPATNDEAQKMIRRAKEWDKELWGIVGPISLKSRQNKMTNDKDNKVSLIAKTDGQIYKTELF